MHRLVKNLQALGELGEMLEPTESVKPGVEHVMVEIAPGVFRSQHRRKAPAGGRLLRELTQLQGLRDSVKTQFEALTERANERRRGQR